MITKTISAFRKPFLLSAALALCGGALAQEPELDPAALEDLVAPVALYPDDVLGIILPASTFPIDVVEAARFLAALEDDPTLTPDEAWDDSIVALLNYPEVIAMMNEDLDWTWALGEAVLIDQEAVLAAAQRFRAQAYAAGNLQSDDRQIVSRNAEIIEIRPADPEVIYIPVYEPREVIVYQRAPVVHYYPIAYPVYYYPYPVGYSFGVDYFWGVSSWFSLGWHTHHVHVLHHTDRLHPYYLNSYYFYRDYYPRTQVYVTVTVNDERNVWVPSARRTGNRPRTITTESRTSTVRTGRSATVETQPGISGSTRSSTSTTTNTAITRAPGNGSQRTTTTRSIESPPVTSSTRSVRTSEAPAATGSITRAPETRSQSSTRSQTQEFSQPSTRSQTVTPAPRSSVSTQGSSTRRSSVSQAPVYSPPPSSPPPVYSPPPSSPAPVYSPPPSQTAAPSTRSSQSSSPAPRQAPSDSGSTRTRMR